MALFSDPTKSTRVAMIFLSMTIGFFFVFMGTIKLTPKVNEEIYRLMRKIFIKQAKAFPLATITGYRPSGHVLRKCIGTNEVVAGLALAIVPGALKNVANIALLVSCAVQVYLQWAAGEALDKMTPAVVFSLLLLCRLAICCQLFEKIRGKAFGKSSNDDEEDSDTEERLAFKRAAAKAKLAKKLAAQQKAAAAAAAGLKVAAESGQPTPSNTPATPTNDKSADTAAAVDKVDKKND